MGGCFVPRCKLKRKTKTHLFRAPAAVADIWVNVMKKIRVDEVFDPQNANHRVCHKHFEEEDLVKSYDSVVIRGEIVSVPRKNWTIKSDAIPKNFESIPPSIRPKPVTLRRKLIRHSSLSCKKQKLLDNEKHEETNPDVEEVFVTTETEISLNEVVTKVKEWWSQDYFKPGWLIDASLKNELVSFQYVTLEGGAPVEHKLVTVFVQNGEIIVNSFVDKILLQNESFLEISELPATLLSVFRFVDETSICRGVKGFLNISACKSGEKGATGWRSVNCHKLGIFRMCQPCKELYYMLRKPRLPTNLPKLKKTNLKANRRQKLWYFKSKASGYKNKLKSTQMELRKIKTFIVNADLAKISACLEKLSLSRQTKEAIVMSITSAQRKSNKGFRYSTCWLLECLLLRIKSPAAYNHLRESKLLALPHPRTLRKLISGQPCEFGFSQAALNAIRREFQDKDIRDRQGVLTFDEVQLRESLDYNPHSYKLTGYVDFGDDNDDLNLTKDSPDLANHALVIMFRPLNDSWVQPICAFATKNAAKGNALHRIVMQAIIKLESVGAQVLSVNCDGAKPNKSFWKLCGIGESTEGVANKIIHPFDDNRYLFFTSDVPHIFKCSRNHCLKYKWFNYFGDNVDFSFYEALLVEDSKRTYGLRKCPKLTKCHIWPNPFERMSVPLMAQLFSRSVATGLQFYREMGVENFKESEATEKFTLEMNSIFDALNAWHPDQGITINSYKYKILKTFYEKLCTVDINTLGPKNLESVTFASKETLIGLKVTIKSTLEIIDYLISQLGYKYVLTAKLNQDCLEKFFGILRGAGGREEHPTVSNFIQLFRLLSLYTPIKRCVRSSVLSESPERILVDLEDEFRTSRKINEEKKALRGRDIDELIVEKLLNAHLSSNVSCSEESNQLDVLDKNIVYYLAGFLCHRSNKLLSCKNCVDSLSTNCKDDNLDCSKLTGMLDYGGLCYPHETFFHSLLEWEKSFCNVIGNWKNNGDIIMQCLFSVSGAGFKKLGCSETGHDENVLKVLLPYYITMRLHFYTRCIRNGLGKGKMTKNKRKESKVSS